METVKPAAPQEATAAPVQIATPKKEEVVYSAATLQQTDTTDTAGEDGEAVQEAAPATSAAAAPAPALPKTASPVPFLGLMGILLLAIGLLTRRVAMRLQ